MDNFFSNFWIFNLAMLFILNLLLWRDLKNPAVFGSFMWFSIIVLHRLVPHGLYQLESEIISVVFFSVLVFSVGVIIGQIVTKNIPAADSESPLRPNTAIVYCYIAISIVALPFLIKSAMALASHNITPNFFVNLRIALSDEENPQTFGALSYAVTIAFSAHYLRLADTSKSVRSIGTLLITLICFACCLLGTGRTYFFLLLIPSLFIILFSRPGILKARHILFFILALVAVFVLMGQFLGKIDNNDKGAISSFSLYLFGGVSAFQELLKLEQHFDYGTNTFRTVFAVFSALGLNIQVPSLIQGYTYIPIPTNVYTVFQPYFLDFGLWYVYFAQFVYGLLQSCLYSYASRRYTIGVLFYSLSMYALFMQWFQDQYITLLSLWVQYAILLLAPIMAPPLYYLFIKHLATKGDNRVT